MDNLVWIFISALLINNFVLAYFLGLCPFLGVSGRLETSFRLGLATIGCSPPFFERKPVLTI